MLGKNNYWEKKRQLQEQDKRERFGIRKLAIGAASILLGFSFLMGSKENVKADTMSSDPSAAVSKADNAAKNTDKPTDTQKATTDHSSAKPKLSTYAGLRSFLRTSPSDDEHNSSAEQAAPGEDPANAPEFHELSDNHQDDSAILDQPDNQVSSSPVDPEQAKELNESATYLETEISQGQEFVETDEFKAADTAKQTALTTAISAGQDLLTRYQASIKDVAPTPAISLKDGGTPVTLEELNAAGKQIEQAINDIKNPVSTRSDHTWSDGDCVLVYDATNKTLHVKAGENGNTLIGGTTYNSFSYIVNNIRHDGQTETYPIEKLVFDDNVVLPANASYKFANLVNLTEIDGLDKVDTSNVTDMSNMFEDDSALTSLDLSKFNTSNVTDMSAMFAYDSALTSLDLSKFNTSKVTTMAFMFSLDSALTSLDLSNFDTSNVTNMSGMFEGLSKMTSLPTTDLDTRKVTDMSHMFYNDSALTSLDLRGFVTSNVTNMSDMFSGDSALTSLDLSNFDTRKVTNMSLMFIDDSALTSLDLSNFNTSKVTDMSGMFEGDSALTNLDLNKFNTSKVTDMSGMFAYDSALTSLDIGSFDTSNVTTMYQMFNYDRALTSLDLSNFNTSNVTDMSQMFAYDDALTSLDLSNVDTSKVTDMSYMFYYDSELTSLDLSNFDTSKVTDMSYMFREDRELTSLDLSNFDTSNVTDMSGMFYDDESLTSLDLSNFDTTSISIDSYGNYETQDMLHTTGNPNRFVLKLGQNTKLYGNSSVGSGKNYIREVGSGAENDPQGDFLNKDQLESLYNGEIGTLPVETYIMANSSDATTYNPVASLLTVHNNQVSAGDPDALLDFGNGLTVSGLKAKTDDFAPANKTIMDIKWLPNKVMTPSGLADGGLISDESGKLRYDADGVADQQGDAVIEVNYGDGSTDNVPVTIIVVGAKGQPQTVTSGEEITRPVSDFITEASKNVISSFNPQYSFVKDNVGHPLDNHKSAPTLNWRPGQDSQNVYVKVSYYTDAEHTEPDGYEIITVPVTVTPVHQNVTVHHYLQDTTTTVPGMTDQTVTGNVNDTVTVSATAPEQQAPIGYTKVTTTDQTSPTITADGGQEVTFYYTANPVTVNVEHKLKNGHIIGDNTGNDRQYYVNGIGDSLNGSATEHVGDTVTVTANDAPKGYILLSDKTQTHEITPDEGQSSNASENDPITITFNYDLVLPVGATITVYPGATLPDVKQLITNYNDLAGDNINVTWADGVAPDISELGTKTAAVTVTSSDNNFGSQEAYVTIKVIAKPGLTMADMYHPVGGTIEVPQYTDMPQDSTYAQAGIINNSDMPDGTTYIWERHNGQMPDTSIAGTQHTGFVRVTFPDDSYKSVKVSVTVADNVTKDITLKHNAYIYDANGKRANGITLTSGSQIKTYGTKVINGRKFYILDNANYYLAAGNDKPVTQKLDHNAYIYNSKGKRVGKHMMYKGGEVKTYGIPVTIKGKEYYSIGNGHYMKKNNFPPTPKWQEPQLSDAALAAGHSMQHLAKNSYLYDENGKRSGQLTLKSGSSVEVTGVKTINGENYYALADGGYIKQSNFAD